MKCREKEVKTLNKITYQSYALRIFENNQFSSLPPLPLQDLKHTEHHHLHQRPAPLRGTNRSLEEEQGPLGHAEKITRERKKGGDDQGTDFLGQSEGTQYGLE